MAWNGDWLEDVATRGRGLIGEGRELVNHSRHSNLRRYWQFSCDAWAYAAFRKGGVEFFK